MDLSPGALTALKNLSRKKLGLAVDWIAISDARALTELGLAERTRNGWRITPSGETVLDATDQAATAVRQDNVLVVAVFGEAARGGAGYPIFRSPLPQ
jgi:hypothetical protein